MAGLRGLYRSPLECTTFCFQVLRGGDQRRALHFEDIRYVTGTLETRYGIGTVETIRPGDRTTVALRGTENRHQVPGP
jgi:hypothetical protein